MRTLCLGRRFAAGKRGKRERRRVKSNARNRRKDFMGVFLVGWAQCIRKRDYCERKFVKHRMLNWPSTILV